MKSTPIAEIINKNYLFDKISYSRDTEASNSIPNQVRFLLLQMSTGLYNKPANTVQAILNFFQIKIFIIIKEWIHSNSQGEL